MTKEKIHIVYKLDNGTRVPGVTTVIGLLAKPALIHWSWKLGTEGIDYRKIRDQAADIGTIAHEMIRAYLRKEKFDTSDYASKDIDKAETAFLAFLEWADNQNLNPLATEIPLVSQKYRYGGTIDLYAGLNGKKELVDFKTSKGIYPDMRVQVAAYYHLLKENKFAIEGTRILQINKETGAFSDHVLKDLSDEWELFLCLRRLYDFHRRVFK